MTGGNYVLAERKDAGTSKIYAYVLAAPVALGTHWFAVTCYVLDGTQTLESGFSNEVSWQNAPTPATLTLTSIAQNISRKEAELLAEASMGTNAKVQWKLAGYGNWTSKIVDVTYLKTEHSILLGGLRPHSNYDYIWTVESADGQIATSSGSFVTK